MIGNANDERQTDIGAVNDESPAPLMRAMMETAAETSRPIRGKNLIACVIAATTYQPRPCRWGQIRPKNAAFDRRNTTNKLNLTVLGARSRPFPAPDAEAPPDCSGGAVASCCGRVALGWPEPFGCVVNHNHARARAIALEHLDHG
jgi:hypothetical protein